jgi:P4 family phage/plasmid primase-like protien
MYDAACHYHELGYTVASCKLRLAQDTGKKDIKFAKSWGAATHANCLVDHIDDAHNGLVIITGKPSDLLVVDCDTKDPARSGVTKWLSLVASHGGVSTAPVVRSASGGLHIYFSLSKSIAQGLKSIRNRTGMHIGGQLYDIDIRAEGGIVLTCPTEYEKGTYTWEKALCPSVELQPCPHWLIDELNRAPRQKLAISDEDVSVEHGICSTENDDASVIQKIKKYLSASGDNSSMFMHTKIVNGELLYIFRTQGPRICPYGVQHHGSNNFSVIQRDNELFYRCHGTQCSSKMAQLMSALPFEDMIKKATSMGVDPRDQTVYDGLDLKYTSQKFQEADRGGAELFAKMYAVSQRIVYCEREFWYWDGKLWAKDDEGKRIATVMSHQLQGAQMRFTARLSQAIHDETDSEEREKLQKLAVEKPQNWTKATAVKQPLLFLKDCLSNIDFCRKLGSNPDVLCVDNGVILLPTGEIVPHHPKYLCHTCIDVEWKGVDHPTPDVDAFFKDIFNYDTAAILYIQRLLGYGVTGHNKMQKFAIFYGAGGNGKGILNQMLQNLLGDYYVSMNKDCIIKSERGSGKGAASPYMAELRQKRIAVCDESEDQEKLDDGSIKLATGGSAINCRFLYGNPITFIPTHMPVLMTNHKPVINSEDGAMIRRLILVPFVNQYKEAHEYDATDPNHRLRDDDMAKRMTSEPVLEQFLVWLVRGAIDWYRLGSFGPQPDLLNSAMQEYMMENDLLGQFLSDFCIKDKKAVVETKAFRAEYESVMETTISSVTLVKSMRNRGFVKKQIMKDATRGCFFVGIRMKTLQGADL